MKIKNFLRITLKYVGHTIYAKSRKGHGIHSPFVFDLCTHVFSKKMKSIEKIEELRVQLMRSKEQIAFSDIGAGSSVESNRTRKVREIARYSTNKKVNKLLYKLVDYLKPESIIELGTSFGFSTMYMAEAGSQSKIVSVEGVPEIACISIKNFAKLRNRNVQIIESDFDKFLDSLDDYTKGSTLLFLDGNHTKEATLKYFNHVIKHITDDSVIVIDDINWSKGMNEAWEAIKESEKVFITIDLFFVGLVFFKKGIRKQNFKIRF